MRRGEGMGARCVFLAILCCRWYGRVSDSGMGEMCWESAVKFDRFNDEGRKHVLAEAKYPLPLLKREDGTSGNIDGLFLCPVPSLLIVIGCG